MTPTSMGSRLERFTRTYRDDSAVSWATLAAGLLASACTILVYAAITRVNGGAPPAHVGLYLVPLGCIAYTAPALLSSRALGDRKHLRMGPAPALLTFLGTCVIIAAALSIVLSEPITYSAYAVILYSPVIAAAIIGAELIRIGAVRFESTGIVALGGATAWAGSWLLSLA